MTGEMDRPFLNATLLMSSKADGILTQMDNLGACISIWSSLPCLGRMVVWNRGMGVLLAGYLSAMEGMGKSVKNRYGIMRRI